MHEPKQPIFAILSQLLIAYTSDFDDEFSARLPAAEKAPSLAMWANVLRFIAEDGIALKELSPLSGIAKPTIRSMAQCLERHGWITVDAKGLVRFTERGAAAKKTWPAVQETIERRWREILDPQCLAALAEAAKLHSKLPHYPMPAAHRGASPRGE